MELFRNPQLVSMYLYVCSKTGEATTGWNYLRFRVVESYLVLKREDKDGFIGFFNSDDQLYLCNAARKWLLTNSLLDDFILHCIAVTNEINALKDSILLKFRTYILDHNLQKNSDWADNKYSELKILLHLDMVEYLSETEKNIARTCPLIVL
ncbi:MAG: hypothetical protein R3Y53_01790 [Bacillota bacterium]